MSLNKKSVQLENEINHLKQHGVAFVMSSSRHIQKKPQRTTRKGFQAPVGKINEILKQATKQDLAAIKGRWGEIIEQLNFASNALTGRFVKRGRASSGI